MGEQVGKKVHVSEDTQIHMSTTYSRNGKGKKKNIFRSFNFVIKGILISTTLVGAVLGGGAGAKAATEPIKTPVAYEYNIDSQDLFKEESAFISNLKMANKVLESAIKTGELSASMYDRVLDKLAELDTKLVSDKEFKSIDSLLPVLNQTDKVLKASVDSSNFDILAKRAQSLTALEKVQDALGVAKSERRVDALIKEGIVVQHIPNQQVQTLSATATKASVSQLQVKEAAVKNISTYIDGIKLMLSQQSVIKSGKVMIPVSSIFKEFGYTIKSDSKKATVTASKKGSTIVLTLNKNTAVVNGRTVKMSANAQTINKVTMVSLDFAGTALGVTTKFDAKANAAHFTTKKETPTKPPTTTAPSTGKQVVNGITVDYGKHTYASKNQAEYNKVMEIVKKAAKDYEKVKIGDSSKYEKYLLNFLEGERWDGNISDRSEKAIGLRKAEGAVGELLQEGVKEADVLKVYRASMLAGSLIKGMKDPGTGAPNSAYDALVRKITDCDSDAQVYAAVLDFLGFNTAILSGIGHADVIVELNGKWFGTSSGNFNLAEIEYALKNGSKIHTQPTNGDIINKDGSITKKK